MRSKDGGGIPLPMRDCLRYVGSGQTRIAVGIWGGPPRGRPLVDGLTSCSVVHSVAPLGDDASQGTAWVFVQCPGVAGGRDEGGGGEAGFPRSIVGWDWHQKVQYSFVGTDHLTRLRVSTGPHLIRKVEVLYIPKYNT